MSKSFWIKTYGCQMNVYDSDKIALLLKNIGYTKSKNPEAAQLLILNTCHIREKADQKMYSDIGRLRQIQAENKDVIIAVGGCVAQAEGEEILKKTPWVEIIFGPQTYHRLPEMLAKVLRKRKETNGKFNAHILEIDFPVESKFDFLPQETSSPISAFLSVQEGCDKFCHFCVVPYTRGAEFSRPAKQILEEAKHLAQTGAKEITLLGQNVTAYHGESPYAASSSWGLGRLIFEIAAQVPEIERIRYTTSHPRDMNEDIFKAHAEVPQLMPFLHLPAQSGSDAILKSMNRKHTSSDYLKIIEKLKKSCPTMAFSSDFIVGYPGESEKDFQDTLSLIKAVSYSQAYSFKYSPRPGTPAALMDNQVEEEIKTIRLQEIQALLNERQMIFNQNTIGTTQKVLFDKVNEDKNQLMGKTPYMQSVHVPFANRLLGNTLEIKIIEAHPNSLSGMFIFHDSEASDKK